MATAAGCLLRAEQQDEGHEEVPPRLREHEDEDDRDAGAHERQDDPSQGACIALAPSTQAASSSEIGTESMKFFVIQIAIGSDDAAMKRIVADQRVEQVELHEQA